MPPTPDNHDAHDYAERICERLPRRLQELREAAGMSRYALAKKSGVSLEMISRIEGGESIPTLHVSARLAYGVDLTLTEDRVVYGSNWPVCEKGGTYADEFKIVSEYSAAKRSGASEQHVWKNSLAAYRWIEC